MKLQNRFYGLFLLISMISLIIFSSSICLAANSYTVTVQLKPMKISDQRFYIKEVIDGRQDKSTIGLINHKFSNKKMPLFLNGELEKVIKSFMDTTFQPVDNKIPIIIRVDSLQYSEWTGVLARFEKLDLKLEFYREQNGAVYKIFEYESSNEFPMAILFLEKHLRSELENCLKSFIASDWENKQTELIDYAQLRTPDPKQLELEHPLNVSHHAAVALEGSQGLNSSFYGLNLLSYSIHDYGKSYLIHTNLDVQSITKDNTQITAISFAPICVETLNHLGSSNWYTSFTPSIPLGINSKSQFSIGLRLNEALYYFPVKTNYIFYCGVFQFVSTDSTYSSDLGLKLGVGIQF